MAGCAHCGAEGRGSARLQGDGFVACLAGNPNTGKSSIFNHLTGAKQHVGNWPGKTVSEAHGAFHHDGVEVQIVDLPGTYSLNASSPEEIITRDYLVHDRPDIVIVVVDASNLERNLYIVVQILEIGLPTVVALNMIDVEALSKLLGVPVIPTVARRGQGLDTLRCALSGAATFERAP